jgi:hypothetical protein
MTVRNPPLDGIKRQKPTVRDVCVLPLSYVDPDRNLWRSGGYQVRKRLAAQPRSVGRDRYG